MGRVLLGLLGLAFVAAPGFAAAQSQGIALEWAHPREGDVIPVGRDVQLVVLIREGSADFAFFSTSSVGVFENVRIIGRVIMATFRPAVSQLPGNAVFVLVAGNSTESAKVQVNVVFQ